MKSCGEKVSLLRIPEIEEKLNFSDSLYEATKEDISKPQAQTQI